MSQYVPVAKFAELAEGKGRCVEVKGRLIALFRQGDAVHAIDDCCPHMGAPLSDGHVQDGIVRCGWHGWRFSILNGDWADVPGSPGVISYPTKIEGPDVFVAVTW